MHNSFTRNVLGPRAGYIPGVGETDHATNACVVSLQRWAVMQHAGRPSLHIGVRVGRAGPVQAPCRPVQASAFFVQALQVHVFEP